MVAPHNTSISIPKVLYDQAEMLALSLDLAPNQVFAIAIGDFVRRHQDPALGAESDDDTRNQPNPDEQSRPTSQAAQLATPIDEAQPAINQGDIYWVQLDDIDASEPGIPHPYVVLQDDILNYSRIHTVVVCALTSNIRRASAPGNLLLDAGEANLPRRSVVEVSKVSTVDKTQLGAYIGSLAEPRIHQILAGMRFLQRSFFART